MRNFILILFSAHLIISQAMSAPWVFVKPILTSSEAKADISKIDFVTDANQKVLLFKTDNNSDVDEIKNLLDQSEMIEFVHQLRNKARKMHLERYSKYASVDTVDTHYAVTIDEFFGKGGPAVASLRIKLKDNDLRSNSLLILAPIGLQNDQITINDFVKEQYLAPLIAHEFFHGIMGDIYGERMLEMKARSLSNKGHRADLVTDQYLAFIEGTAEAMELATLDMFPEEINHELVSGDEWSVAKRNLFKQIKYKRLVAAKHNHLGLVNDGHARDGNLDSAEDILNTEGVIATLIYNLLFKSSLENSFEKLLKVLIESKPMTFIEFIDSFVRIYPEHKEQVIRQFLESTRFVTVSYEAPMLYKQQYLMKKRLKQGLVSKLEYQKISTEWAVHRAKVLTEILKGEISIAHTITPIYGIKDEIGLFDFNLNKSTSDQLYALFANYFNGISTREERTLYVGKILRMLESKSFIKDTESLPFPKHIKAQFAELNTEYENYYSTLVELRYEMLNEYSSWVSSDDNSINNYKLHR